MSRKATKFYVRRPDGSDFITLAEEPHQAVVLLWRHQLKAAAESGRETDITAVPILRTYAVHTGREAEAVTVSAGRAYWGAHRAIASAVACILTYQFGEEECDRLLWDGSGEVPIRVRYLKTLDELDQA